jgi:hypothetical protein
MKTVPHFRQCNTGNKKMGGVLGIMPCDQARIGSWFLSLANRVRVEHEIHKWMGLAMSFGIRGGSQSVVKRIESCHALSLCMEWRALLLGRDGRADFFKKAPFGWCLASQPNNSRAWRADSFLTFLTASSTVLTWVHYPGKCLEQESLIMFIAVRTSQIFRSAEFCFPERGIYSAAALTYLLGAE